MSNPQIDDTDSRIISLLEEDGRRSNRDIARILGITEKQVGARIRRLLQQDVMRIVAVVDVFAAGFEFMMTAGVRVDNRPATEVAQQLAEFPEVLSVLLMSGPYDIEIVLVARDYPALAQFVQERLCLVKGIRSITPSLRLQVFKFETGMAPIVDHASDTVPFPESSDLDAIDQGIIRCLWENPRATNQDIALRLRSSESTVRMRIADMRRRNVLRITAVNNLGVGEGRLFAFVGIGLDGAHHAAVAEQLCAMRAVRFVAAVLGRYDMLAMVLVDSAAQLVEFAYQRIATIRGVRSVELAQALRFVKYDYRWTLIRPKRLGRTRG